MTFQHNIQKIIYLAEDDEDDRPFFLEAVEELNLPISVMQAGDGNELIELLNKTDHLPDLMFLDINMPCKDGFDTLKEIKSTGENWGKIKIIMFSTSISIIHIKLCYKLGADFYAVKPGTFQEMRELLNKVLDKNFISLRESYENHMF